MKTFKKIFSLCLVMTLLVCPLGGCISITQQEPEEPKEDAEKIALSTRVAELESTLQTEREENYIIKTELENRIKELEERISLLANNNQSGDTDSSKMIFHYTMENGVATITKYEGTATLVEIPTTLDGYTVVRIGERAFEGNTHVAAVTIPSSITTIDWFAFYNCTSLFDITIPAEVKEIGHAVFDGCSKPTITCPKGSYAAQYAKSYGISYIEK